MLYKICITTSSSAIEFVCIICLVLYSCDSHEYHAYLEPKKHRPISSSNDLNLEYDRVGWMEKILMLVSR